MGAKMFIQFKTDDINNLSLSEVKDVTVDTSLDIIKVKFEKEFLHVDLRDVSSFHCTGITPFYK